MGTEILSRERILAAALQLVDAEGVSALSMRRLATMLGVDPMAIYRHLPDKAALITGMVEMVLGKFQIPAVADSDWRSRVRAFAAAYRALVKAHPNLIIYLVTHAEASAPAALAVGEYLFAALHQTGLSPLQVVTASNLIVDYLNGFALGESSGQMGQPAQFESFYALLHTLPPDRYPTMQSIYGTLDEATLQTDGTRELELILDGIAAWLHE
jgi:TetR/AcrR family transcriptional regulator, tetracycline repressor protein